MRRRVGAGAGEHWRVPAAEEATPVVVVFSSQAAGAAEGANGRRV